jgi:NAD(P)-dependent dehydrogenase (short-subunit alcohol dehydrogenase family)
MLLADRVGCRFERADLMDIPATQALIARLVEEGGAFDVLVNNAANDDRHDWSEVTPDYRDNRMGVNLKHHFFCAQSVTPCMRAKGGGAIVNLGSISWHLGLKDLPLYRTAKAAIEGLTARSPASSGRTAFA